MGIKTAGRELDVTYSYLSKIENNHKVPSPQLLEKLCEFYGGDRDELLAAVDRLPDDIQQILHTHREDAFRILRDLFPNNDDTPDS